MESRSVAKGIIIGTSHFHTLGADLASLELHSALKKAHYFDLNFRYNSRKRANTFRRLARWSSTSLPRTMASSRKASTIFQVRPRNTKFMTREKVAEALLSPNPIRANLYRPYWVTKAVFLWSSGQILIW